MIFYTAEYKPRKSGKIKFKVQELKSLDDCSALRDVSIMIKIDKVVLCFTKNRQLFKLFQVWISLLKGKELHISVLKQKGLKH